MTGKLEEGSRKLEVRQSEVVSYRRQSTFDASYGIVFTPVGEGKELKDYSWRWYSGETFRPGYAWLMEDTEIQNETQVTWRWMVVLPASGLCCENLDELIRRLG